MKKIILFFVSWAFLSVSEAQTWEVPVYRFNDGSWVKMLKLNSRMELTIRTQLHETDSAKEDITLRGLFHSGSADSLIIKLDEYKSLKQFPDGTRQTTTIPPDIYLLNSFPGNGLKSIALEDIGFLKVQKWPKAVSRADNIFEPVIFASLFVLIASPLISYNYKEGYLNTETYKNWALGSTITLTSCFAVLMVINSQSKNYQFHPGWPDKKAKVWKFRLTQP
jgi:hypothetical protein